MDVCIRHIIRRDMKQVLEIENNNSDVYWNENDFLDYLKQINCIGIVAEYNQEVVGFLIYEVNKEEIRILNFSVKSEMRRCGICTQMLQSIKNKLSYHQRRKIVLIIGETNFDAILFFQTQGFQTIQILYTWLKAEECYIMQFELGHITKRKTQLKNRIKAYLKV